MRTRRVVRFENELHHALQRRDVAADTDLAIFAGDPGRAEGRHLDRILRRCERSSARSRSGFITTIGTPRLDASRSGVIIRGLLVPGILPDHEDRVGLVEILEHHGALADADALGQADAGRLVAHVGAVGKVVRAEAAHEDLIEERRFVRSAARGVEVRLVGALQRAELRADQGEGVVPADRHVVVRRAVVAHRLGQAPLLLQPVVALLFQFADGVGGKELRRHPSLGELEGDGFGAILAKLEGAGMPRIRPGASRAVKAVRLVHRQQRL